MGRSLQQIAKAVQTLSIGSSFVRTHGTPFAYIVTEVRPKGGIDGGLLIKGTQIPFRACKNFEISHRHKIPGTMKSDWRVVVDADVDARERLKFIEKSASGAMRISDEGIELIKARKAPFDGDERRKYQVLHAVREARRATTAALAAKAAAAQAAKATAAA